MRAVIESKFSTAKETGDALGVPSSRVKALVDLTRSAIQKTGLKVATLRATAGLKKRKGVKKAASRKRYARGKIAKTAR